MDSEMDPKLWGTLPSDIQFRCLSYLNVPVLSRFRTVSKHWNSTITTCSHFRALHLKNAKAHRYILGRAAKVMHLPGQKSQFSKSIGWRLLDVDSNRWYFIEHDADDSYDSYESRSLSVNGGLACAYYLDPMAPLKNHVKMCVTNPISKVAARLPPSPYDEPLPIRPNRRVPFVTAMAVEHGEASETFKVYVMCCALEKTLPVPSIVMYDSTTGEWQPSATNLAVQVELCDGLCGGPRVLTVRCMLVFQGFLYAVVTHLEPRDVDGFWQLWRFSAGEDAWKFIIGARYSFQVATLLHPQLVVCGERMFLAAWVVIPDVDVMMFEIVEIRVAVRKWRVLMQGPKRQMEVAFETDFHEHEEARNSGAAYTLAEYLDESSVPGQCFAESPLISAFGFENAIILIAKKSGVSRKFNLITRNLEEKQPFARALPCLHEVWYAQPTRLIPYSARSSQLRKSREAELVTLSDSDD